MSTRRTSAATPTTAGRHERPHRTRWCNPFHHLLTTASRLRGWIRLFIPAPWGTHVPALLPFLTAVTVAAVWLPHVRSSWIAAACPGSQHGGAFIGGVVVVELRLVLP